MRYTKVTVFTRATMTTALAGAAALVLTSVPAEAGQQARAAAPARVASAPAGQAVPRPSVAPRVVVPRVVAIAPYRPYFYRPSHFRLGFYYGYPFGYPYFYPYPYYGYGYPGYGYPLAPGGYYAPIPGVVYGGVRIQGAPKDAEVFVDGYYAGIVDDFDGTFKHLDLEPRPHRIEIRPKGSEPIAFDVRVEPGRTMTYHAEMPPVRP
jgi:hypothetical protein